MKYKLLLILLILPCLVSAYDIGLYKVKPYSYGMFPNGQFYNWDGISYENKSGGYMKVYNNGDPLRKIGFGITSNKTNVTTADFNWDWSYNETTDIWIQEDTSPAFDWKIHWDYNYLRPLKIIHNITNNYQDLSDVKMWYIMTVNEDDMIIYNNKVYTNLTHKNRHIQGDLNNITAKIRFPKMLFDFTDIVENYDVTDLFVGNGSMFGYDNQRVLMVGFTKGNGMFMEGQTVMVDPTITVPEVDVFIEASHDNTIAEGNFSRSNITNSAPYDRLQFYHTFDKESSVKSYDYNDNIDGSVTSATWQGGCYDGSGCYKFDGTDDYIDLGQKMNFNSSDNFTFTAWVKADGLSGSHTIISKYDVSGGYGWTIQLDSDKKVRLLIIDKVGGAVTNVLAGVTTNPISDTGSFIGAVYNGSSKKLMDVHLFIDGVEESLTNVSDQLVAESDIVTNVPVTLGGRNLAQAARFNGTIDEVKFFNKTLSPQQIIDIHNNVSVTHVNGSIMSLKFINITTGTTNANFTFDGFRRYKDSNLEFALDDWKQSRGYTACDPSEVARWTLDGNATDSCGENDGVINKATNITGLFGSSFNFNGSPINNIDITHSQSLNITNGTVCAWVMPKGHQEYDHRILDKDGRYGLVMLNNNQNFRFDANNGTYVNCASTTQLANDTWSFICGSSNTTNLIDYVNGVQVQVCDFGGGINVTNGNLRIGNTLDGTRAFNGTIDQVSIYNRSLNAEEVMDLYVNSNLNYNNGTFQNITENVNTFDYAGSEGILACWLNSENESCGNNNGTLVDDAVYQSSDVNIRNQTLELDGGGDYLDTNKNFNDTRFTRMAWFKHNDIERDGNKGGAIFGDTYYTGDFLNGSVVRYFSADYEIDVVFSNGTQSYGILNIPYSDKIWNHIAITYNGSTFSAYKDGKLYGTSTQNYNPSNRDLYIGYDYTNTPAIALNGSIDEVAIWNRSLSASEILTIYKQSKHARAVEIRNVSTGTTIIRPRIRHIGQYYSANFGSTLDFVASYSSNVTPDTTAPTFSNAWNSSPSYKHQNTTFNITITDSESNLQNMTFYWNETGVWEAKINRTGLGVLVYNFNISLNITTRTRGQQFNWNITSCDILGNCDSSINYLVNVSNTALNVAFTNIVNNSNFTGIQIINFTLTDIDLDELRGNITLQNSTNITLLINISDENTTYAFNTSSISDGYYNLVLLGKENLTGDGFEDSLNFNITIDNTAPTILNNSNTSKNGEFEADEWVLMNATITDNLFSVNTIIFSNNFTGNWTNITISDSQYNASVNNFTKNTWYNWRFFANDTLGNMGEGQLNSFFIYPVTTPPAPTITGGGGSSSGFTSSGLKFILFNPEGTSYIHKLIDRENGLITFRVYMNNPKNYDTVKLHFKINDGVLQTKDMNLNDIEDLFETSINLDGTIDYYVTAKRNSITLRTPLTGSDSETLLIEESIPFVENNEFITNLLDKIKINTTDIDLGEIISDNFGEISDRGKTLMWTTQVFIILIIFIVVFAFIYFVFFTGKKKG